MLTDNETQAAQQFWNWFGQKQLPLEFFDEMTPDQQEELLDEMNELAALYSEGVNIQPGKNMSSEGPEFRVVISASGQIPFFKKAKALAALAPEIPNWQVYALLPPLPRTIQIRFELESGLLFPNDMWFLMMGAPEDSRFLGLHIALRHFDHYEAKDELEELQHIVIQMVANIIGEESFAMDIQHLQLGPLPSDPMEEGFLPLYDLPDEIAAFRQEFPSPRVEEL